MIRSFFVCILFTCFASLLHAEQATIAELSKNLPLPLRIESGGTGEESREAAMNALLPPPITEDLLLLLENLRSNVQEQLDEAGLSPKAAVRAATTEIGRAHV